MGKIIVIEGTDGSGKQTQAVKLYEALIKKGYNAMQISFPNYQSPSSGGVKMYLGGEFGENAKSIDAYQASVFFSVDRLCTMLKLKDFYENDGIIVIDRYVQSNMIHQAGKISDKKERERFLNWIDDFEFNVLKLPREDIVLFLDVPIKVSKSLANARKELKSGTKLDIHEKDEKHLADAYEAGKFVAKKFSWEIINCVEEEKMKSIEQIHQEILSKVNAIC